MRQIGIAFAVAAAFAALCYSIAIYNIEAAKQEGTMMNSCVGAGGDWLLTWNNQRYCKLPVRYQAQ